MALKNHQSKAMLIPLIYVPEEIDRLLEKGIEQNSWVAPGLRRSTRLEGASTTDTSCVVAASTYDGEDFVIKAIQSSERAPHRQSYEEVYPMCRKDFPELAKFLVPRIYYKWDAITVGGQTFDLIAMPHYATSISSFLEKCRTINDTCSILHLAYHWRQLGQALDNARIIYGDLHDRNIFIDENGLPILIDLDSLCLASHPEKALEVQGNANYQHPARFTNEGNAFFKQHPWLIDRFSHLTIYLAIIASADPSLQNILPQHKRKLLFSASDFIVSNYANPIFDLLTHQTNNPCVRKLARHIKSVCQHRLSAENFRPISDILPTDTMTTTEQFFTSKVCFNLSGRTKVQGKLDSTIIILISQAKSMGCIAPQNNCSKYKIAAGMACDILHRVIDQIEAESEHPTRTAAIVLGYNTGDDRSPQMTFHLAERAEALRSCLGLLANGWDQEVAVNSLDFDNLNGIEALRETLWETSKIISELRSRAILNGPTLVINLTDGTYNQNEKVNSDLIEAANLLLKAEGVLLSTIVVTDTEEWRSFPSLVDLPPHLKTLAQINSPPPASLVRDLRKEPPFSNLTHDSKMLIKGGDLQPFLKHMSV